MTDSSLNTYYKKSLGKNYMIIDLADTENYTLNSDTGKNFRIRMLHENVIPGILNTHIQYTDDIPSFQYDITGLQSLEVILDTIPLSHPILCKIFSAIYNALLSMEDYLLIHDHVMLSPEYIYLTADFTDIRLCYCPVNTNSFNDSIRSFFDYLLKRVNHSDEKCVYLAYSMHKCASEPDFNINKLYTLLSSIPKELPPNVVSNVKVAVNDDKDISTTVLSSKPVEVTSDKPSSSNNSYINNYFSEGRLKTVLLIATTVMAIGASTIFYLSDFYTFSFYAVLLLTICTISGYNGYHLYRQYGHTKLDTVVTSAPKVYDSSTVLLAAAADDNTHKLIYTGVGDGEDISLTHYPFVIGKAESCSVKLSNSAISRLHAKLSLLPVDDHSDDIFLEDLNSTNGTLINNAPLTPYEKYPLNSGDYITFGHLTYIFR